MRVSKPFALLTLVCLSSADRPGIRDHDTHTYYALHLRSDEQPQKVAAALGLDYEGKLGELPRHHTFSSPKHRRHNADSILEDVRNRRRKRDLGGLGALEDVLWHQKQKVKPRMVKRDVIPSFEGRQGPPVEGAKADPGTNVDAVAERTSLQKELSIDDPIFDEQWHLFNAIQLGHDINVTGVWQQGIFGEGATAVMVDDGIDMYSDDLKDNYFAKGSYDFNDNTDEPKPRLSDDRHGTRCAGEIAAVKNGVCGVGVAYKARIGGIRILSKVINDEDEATAMNYKYQDNQIYSCSWGPPDDGRSMDAPGLLIRKALVNAVQNGRQGKGNIFVFAAGNGNNAGDNCNFDGYTNSIYTVTIGGIDRKGQHPYYSEHCSAQLAVTYSSGAGDAIHTTDVGVNKCYANHGGTSAAAPLGAGIIALAFSARPELTWRDVQNLVVLTSVPVNVDDEWQTTSTGLKYSHVFGYGKLDAYALVEKAKSIDLLKPQAWYTSPWMHVNHPVPQGVEGLLSDFEITEGFLKKANVERVEHVTVTMNVEHTRRGDLSVELRSPTGVVSHLSVARRLDDVAQGYVDWTFMSMAHWWVSLVSPGHLILICDIGVRMASENGPLSSKTPKSTSTTVASPTGVSPSGARRSMHHPKNSYRCLLKQTTMTLKLSLLLQHSSASLVDKLLLQSPPPIQPIIKIDPPMRSLLPQTLRLRTLRILLSFQIFQMNQPETSKRARISYLTTSQLSVFPNERRFGSMAHWLSSSFSASGSARGFSL